MVKNGDSRDRLSGLKSCCCYCCLIAKSCPIFCNPMNCGIPGFPVLHYLPEFAHTHVQCVDDAIQPCHPLLPRLLLLSIFPSIRFFSNELALCMRWPKYLSFSISPSDEYSGLISFRIDWLISLQSKGLSRVFSSTTLQRHQFFSTQPSLWSNSQIYTRLLEKSCILLNNSDNLNKRLTQSVPHFLIS